MLAAGGAAYRVIMNVSVSGDTWTQTGSFWNHTDPTDPNSPLGTKITDLNFVGSLSNPGNSLDLTTPGQIGLMAHVAEAFGDGINTAAGGTPANPLVDNVGVSITNFCFIPEPATVVLLALSAFALPVRRRMR